MTPLMYALQTRNKPDVELIMNYLLKNEKIMGQISPKELSDLIEFSPPSIVDFLNESVKELDVKPNIGAINS